MTNWYTTAVWIELIDPQGLDLGQEVQSMFSFNLSLGKMLPIREYYNKSVVLLILKNNNYPS